MQTSPLCPLKLKAERRSPLDYGTFSDYHILPSSSASQLFLQSHPMGRENIIRAPLSIFPIISHKGTGAYIRMFKISTFSSLDDRAIYRRPARISFLLNITLYHPFLYPCLYGFGVRNNLRTSQIERYTWTIY